MSKLDEQTLRRPDFRGGVPVVLADGNEWIVPRPAVYYTPDDTDAGFAETWNLGPEYKALRDDLLAARELAPALRAELRMAAFLLRLNYDLATADLAALVRLGLDEESDPAHVALRESLLTVALGREPAPKAPAGGSN